MASAKELLQLLDLPEEFGPDLTPLETSQLITLQSMESLISKNASLLSKFFDLVQTHLDLDPESTIQATLQEIFKGKGLNVRQYRALLQGIKQQPEFRGYYKSLKKRNPTTGYGQNARKEGLSCIEADSNFFSNEEICSKLGFSSFAKCDNCNSSDTREVEQVDWSSRPETVAKLLQLLRLDSHKNDDEPITIGVWGSGCGSLAFLMCLFSGSNTNVMTFQDDSALIELQRRVVEARGLGDRLKLIGSLTPGNEDLTTDLSLALLGRDLLLDTQKRRSAVLTFLREKMKAGGRVVTWKSLEVWLGEGEERSGLFRHWEQTRFKGRPCTVATEMYYIYNVK